MPYFDGADGRVYYKHWASWTPRATVVFLHGFGEHSGLYHRLGHALGASGIELWALDEIGHGLSDGDRAVIRSVDDLVENGRRLTAIALEAAPQLPVFLAGHSLGSVAVAVAATRDPAPYRGLVLSGAALSPLDWVVELAGAGNDAELALDPSDLSSDPFYLDELENDPLAFTSAAGAHSLVSVLPPAWEELERGFADVSLPVLFVHGADDPVAPVDLTRRWSARLPDGRIEAFAGARHDVLNEHVHRDVAAAIVDFVAAVTAVPDNTDSTGRTDSTDSTGRTDNTDNTDRTDNTGRADSTGRGALAASR
ncbi:MAG TPA: alpha/beta fold hydrolase [Acidimicrobiales bacterium]|nr:alpha/beta fold hydrolase [Acidimicrobiales bacterium]